MTLGLAELDAAPFRAARMELIQARRFPHSLLFVAQDDTLLSRSDRHPAIRSTSIVKACHLHPPRQAPQDPARWTAIDFVLKRRVDSNNP